MGLWGASDADESKPKNLTTAEKKEVYATTAGWVREAGSASSGNDNTSADPEVLVAIGDLTTSLGAATIDSVDLNTTVADKSDGFTLSVTVRYNEAVDVDTTSGTPTISITNGNEGTGTGRGPHTLSYASGTGTNELLFTLAIAAADGTATNAELAISAAQGTAAGTVTVTA
jgi:hypothetical protein